MKREDTVFLIERHLLHAAMLSPASLGRAAIKAKHFLADAHADLWDIIQALSKDGHPTDPLTVSDFADKQGCKRAAQAAMDIGCDATIFSHAQSEYRAGVLMGAWRDREMTQIAAMLSDDVRARADGAADRAIAALMSLHDEDRDCEYTTRQALTAAMDEIEAAYKAGGALVGIPTSIIALDQTLGGFHDSDLIIVGARPAMGKTGFLGGAAVAGARVGQIGIISAEQPHEQMGLRWLAGGSNISVGRLRAAKLEEQQWGHLGSTVERMRDLPMRIFDKTAPDIAEVIRVARRWKHQYSIKALYVDYLQKLRISALSKAPKHERVGEIASSLKCLARDLKIPVIALAQVSRNVDTREGQRPGMGDLSDSSEIEKEADQILMLWRDKTRPHAEIVDAEIIVEKNRHGNVGTVHCLWRGGATSFVDKAKDPDWMLNR
jgi:replicative DNA helicase